MQEKIRGAKQKKKFEEFFFLKLSAVIRRKIPERRKASRQAGREAGRQATMSRDAIFNDKKCKKHNIYINVYRRTHADTQTSTYIRKHTHTHTHTHTNTQTDIHHTYIQV